MKIQVVKEHNMYKQQQKLQGHNLVFISFQAVSYPLSSGIFGSLPCLTKKGN